MSTPNERVSQAVREQERNPEGPPRQSADAAGAVPLAVPEATLPATAAPTPPNRHPRVLALGIVAVLTLAIADYLLPPRMNFSLPMLSVAGFCGWMAGRQVGMLVGLLATIGFFVSDIRLGQAELHTTTQLWNLAVTAAAFLLMPVLTDRLRRMTTDWEGQVQARTVELRAEVAAREQTEMHLRQAQEELRAVLDAIPEVIFLADAEGRILVANESMASRLGCSVEQLVGKTLEETIPADVAARRRAKFDEAIRTGQPVRFEDTRGGWIYENSVYPLRDAIGRITRYVVFALDITARRAAEMKLQEEQERLQRGLSAARALTWELDAATGMIRYSSNAPEWAEAKDITPYCMLETLLPRIHADDRPAVQRSLEHSLNEGSPFEATYRLQLPNGRWRWVLGRGQPVQDAPGRWAQIRGVSLDITAQRQLEEQLRQSEERLRWALEGTSDGVWDWDFRTDTVFLSPRWKEMLGYRDDELENHLNTWKRLTHPVDRERALAAAADHVAGRTPRYEVEFRMRHKDGRWLHILSRATLVRDAHGKPVRLVGTHTDITIRKKAQDILAESEQRLRLALDGAQMGTWQFDPKTQLGLASERTCELYGFPPTSGLLHVDVFMQRIHPDDRELVRQQLETAFARQTDYVAEFRVVLPDGRTRWLGNRGRVFPGQGAAGPRMFGVTFDITERVRLGRQLVEVTDREQARIGQDLHDGLGQQLVAVALGIHALARRLGHSPEAAAAGELAGLVDQALTQTRDLSRGLHPVRLESGGLRAALEELAAQTRQRAKVACDLEWHGPEVVTDEVTALHLYRIAQEAVQNAVCHAFPEHIRLNLEVSNGQIRLSIQDDGRGLPEGWEQSDGLGLHFIRYRARMIHSRLEITPAQPRGTRITCVAPVPNTPSQ